MVKEAEVCGTREGLINVLSQVTNSLQQNADTYDVTIRGDGDAPDLTLHFRRQDQAQDEADSPWISRFSE